VRVLFPGIIDELCDFNYNYLQAVTPHVAINKALKLIMERRQRVAARGPKKIVIICDDMSARAGEEA